MLLTKIRQQDSPSTPQGFTLLELLLGVLFTVVIVGGTCYAIYSTSSMEQNNEAESEIIEQMNHAADLITDEIHSSNQVEVNADNIQNVAPSFQLPTGAIPVLVLRIPEVKERVIYYAKDSHESNLNTKVVYRWGPSFDNAGNYNVSNKDNPNLWHHASLVSLVNDNRSTPQCSSQEWQINPPQATTGFYTCIQGNNSRLVEMHLQSLVSKSNGKMVVQEISKRAFARSDSQPENENTK